MAKVIRDTPDEPIPYLIKTLKKIHTDQESKVDNQSINQLNQNEYAYPYGLNHKSPTKVIKPANRHTFLFPVTDFLPKAEANFRVMQRMASAQPMKVENITNSKKWRLHPLG